MDFSLAEFYWNPCRFQSSVDDITKAVAILNTLTDEQKKAVRLFGRSRKEDGVDEERERSAADEAGEDI